MLKELVCVSPERIREVFEENGFEILQSNLRLGGSRFWIQFEGGEEAGKQAFDVAIAKGLPVRFLYRVWDLIESTMEFPYWEMEFYQLSEMRSS